MCYVYIIQCNNGSFYTGVTSDLERRFREHQTKSGGWHTKIYKPVKILYTEKYETKIEALIDCVKPGLTQVFIKSYD